MANVKCYKLTNSIYRKPDFIAQFYDGLKQLRLMVLDFKALLANVY